MSTRAPSVALPDTPWGSAVGLLLGLDGKLGRPCPVILMAEVT